MHHFSIKTDAFPLISSDDELMVVHRNQLALNAVMYIGAHREATVEIRSAADREAVETAVVPAVGGSALTIPSGGMVKFDLPGAGAGVLDLVTKITTNTQVYVFIVSAGEFDTFLKQVNVPSI